MTIASLLPPAETTFFDQNGVPLAGGKVYFYVPATTTLKNTYQDPNGITLNTNPVLLDAGGRAIIYGTGQYTQVVYDSNGNLIWNQLTQAGSGSGNGYAQIGFSDFIISPTLAPTIPSSGLTVTLPAGYAILQNTYLAIPVYTASFTDNSITNLWLKPDGTFLTDVVSNTNYTILSHFPNYLHVWQINCLNGKITGIELVSNTYPTVTQQLDISGSIDNFVETFYLVPNTTNWTASTSVTYGELLLTTTGNVYQVRVPGTTGGTAPTSTAQGNITDGTATLFYYCQSSYLGMFRKAANNGIEYYFINQGLEVICHKTVQTTSPLSVSAGTTLISLVKSHIQGVFKHLVGNWIAQGTYVFQQKTIVDGWVWLAIVAGKTATTNIAFVNSRTHYIGQTVTDGTVTWKCIYQAFGNATWVWYDTDSTFLTYIYPDSHDSYASTFASLLCRYVQLTNDYSWLTGNSLQPSGNGTYYTYQQLFDSIIYQNLDIQISNFLSQTFQYNIAPWDGSSFTEQYLEDNCETVKGYRSAAYIYGVLGDTTRQTNALNNVAYIGQGVYYLYNTTYNFFATQYGQDVSTWAGNPNIGWYPYLQAQFFPELCNVASVNDDVLKLIRYNISYKWNNYFNDKSIDIFPNNFIGYLAAKSWQDTDKASYFVQKTERYFMNGGSVAQGYYSSAGAMTIAEYAWYLGIKDAMIAPLTITNISGGILNLQDQQGNIVQFGEPIQYSSAPTYIKGQIYFDTTLNKLRVGGISGWETISST